eukprot:1293967-Prorocentrum_lima.AAC.1
MVDPNLSCSECQRLEIWKDIWSILSSITARIELAPCLPAWGSKIPGGGCAPLGHPCRCPRW